MQIGSGAIVNRSISDNAAPPQYSKFNEVSAGTTRAHVVKEIEKPVGRVCGAPRYRPRRSAAAVSDSVACVSALLTARLSIRRPL
ncbi:unnamed protein product, partial [Iphiclides podalirius]